MLNRITVLAFCCATAWPAVSDFRDSEEDPWYQDQHRQRRQLENEHLTYMREQRGLIVSSITDTIRVMPGIRMPARTPDPGNMRFFLDFQTYATVWDRNTIFLDTPSAPSVNRSEDLRRDWYELRLTGQQNLGRKWLTLEVSWPWNYWGLDPDDDSLDDDEAGQPDVDLVFSLLRERFHNLTMQMGVTIGEELLFKSQENIFNGGGWGGRLGFRHSFSTGRFLYQGSLEGTYIWEGDNTLDDLGGDFDITFERYKVRAAVGGSWRFLRQMRSGLTAQLIYDRWQDLAPAKGGADFGDVDAVSIPVRLFVEWNPSLQWTVQGNVGYNPFETEHHDDGGSDVLFGATIGGTF